jgi:hypothetical protein
LWLATSADTTAANIQAQFKVDVIHGDTLDFTNANIAARLSHTTGYTPNGTSEYIKTAFTPSSSDTGVYSLDNASFGVYTLSSQAGTAGAISLGSYDGTRVAQLVPLLNGFYCNVFVNGPTQTFVSIPTTVFGLCIGMRPNSTTVSVRDYQSATPNTNSVGSSSNGLSTQPFYINARNNTGTADSFTAYSTGAAFLGRLMSGGEADAVAAALNTYMTSVGAAHW